MDTLFMNRTGKDIMTARELRDKENQIFIMTQMHETQLMVKNSLIKNLEDIIDEQEARILRMENVMAGVEEELSPCVQEPVKGIKKLVTQMEKSQEEKSELWAELERRKMHQENNECELEEQRDVIKQLERTQEKLLEKLKEHQETQKSKEYIDKLRERHREAESNINSLKHDLQTHKELYSQVVWKCERLEWTRTEALEKGEARESRMRLLLQELRSENFLLKTQLLESKSCLAQLETKSQQDRLSVSGTRGSISSECYAELERVKQQIAHLTNENTELMTAVHNVKIAHSITKEQLELLQNKISISKVEVVPTFQVNKTVEKRDAMCGTEPSEDSVIMRPQSYDSHHVTMIKCLLKDVQFLRNQYFNLLAFVNEHRNSCDQDFMLLKRKMQSIVSEAISGLVLRYKQEMRTRKAYYNKIVDLKGNIRVFCRIRPLLDAASSSDSSVEVDSMDSGMLHIKNRAGRNQTFTMDTIFHSSYSQKEVFEEIRPLVSSFIDGYNICIFAYGQTGAGKTYTMEGPKSNPGIIYRTIEEMYSEIAARKPDWEFTISVSMLEIYNETVRDLLQETGEKEKLEIKLQQDGGGMCVPGLKKVTLTQMEEIFQIIDQGKRNRATGSTNMNKHSSRSHALLCISVEGINKTANLKTTAQLNLIDLAGSERVGKSESSGQQLEEAKAINKSLSALEQVITALKDKKPHIPYRNSKLTYLLQDSLGGDSKTLMIVQIAPEESHVGESVCSLNFAQRVRSVELGMAKQRSEQINGTASPTTNGETPPKTEGNFQRTGSSRRFTRVGSVRRQDK